MYASMGSSERGANQMPPKKKQSKGGFKRRIVESESSSSDSEFTGENNRILAMDIPQSRTARQLARMCTRRNRNDSFEQEMTSREEPKQRTISFDYKALLTNPAYDNPCSYKTMEPEDFNMDYYYETGLNEVLKFNCPPEELGMKMVDDEFSVNDVERLVGGKRMIAVVVVATQQSLIMPLTNFVKYYNDCTRPDPDSPKGEEKILYNVLSLEFSNTGLTDLVQSPSLVRDLDWASYWPDERKTRMISFENDGTFHVQNMYPRVENYCLMSPTECYTDFHIDFHGTSVWYHVKKGKKVFWIVEPTEQNLKLYEEYSKDTTSETSTFFGDLVERCARVEVLPGNTLIIPSGWIHAVYTPVDSLVFGGNFLHSRAALMQLNVLQGENRIGINKKYRYPYSEEAVFFYLNRVVKAVTGRDYIRPMTRNQQMKYAEYVGDLFREKGMHHRVPTKEDYEKEGIVWKEEWDESPEYMESKAKLAKWDEKKEGEDENKDDIGGMEMTNDFDDMPVLSPKKEKKEEKEKKKEKKEEKEKEKKEEKEKEKKEEKGKKKENGDEQVGHNDLFIDDYTFYHPVSFNLDAGAGDSAVLTRPLSAVEPKMRIDPVALKKELHPMEVPQWEGLIVTYLKKSKVDLPEGLTRPNSLIQAFCRLLEKRRGMATDQEGITLPLSVLPSSEEIRRMYEEHSRRKRKFEERRMMIEEGEGEEDTDWNEENEQPRKKKTRKETEKGGKKDAMKSSKERKERKVQSEKKENRDEKEQQIHAQKSKYTYGFYLWYKTRADRDMREQYRAQSQKNGRSLRDTIRMEVYSKFTSEEKNSWIEKAMNEKEKRNDPSLVSTTHHSTSLTVPLPTPMIEEEGMKNEEIIPFDPPSHEDNSMEMDDDFPLISSSSRRVSFGSSSENGVLKRGRQAKIDPIAPLHSQENQADPSLAYPQPASKPAASWVSKFDRYYALAKDLMKKRGLKEMRNEAWDEGWVKLGRMEQELFFGDNSDLTGMWYSVLERVEKKDNVTILNHFIGMWNDETRRKDLHFDVLCVKELNALPLPQRRRPSVMRVESVDDGSFEGERRSQTNVVNAAYLYSKINTITEVFMTGRWSQSLTNAAIN